MADKQLQKPDWGEFEPTTFDQDSLVERFRRAENKISSHTHEFVISRWRKIHEVRRPIIIWSLLVALVFGAMAIDLLFGQERFQTEASAEASTFIEGAVGKISSLNPLFAETKADELAEKLLFSRLFEYDESGSLKGDLAKSVTISDDELIYTVSLRDDVRWHDGQRVTAEDVKYTIDLFKNQSLNSFTGQAFRGVAVKVVGDFAVEFKLRSAYAPFLSLLNFSILPKHILSQFEQTNLRENEFALQPIGSGKFKFQSLQKVTRGNGEDQILTLTYNDKYRYYSQIERLELHLYQKIEDLENGLRTNEVSAVASGQWLNKDKIGNNSLVDVRPLNNGVFAFFNMSREPLKEVGMREALRAVINAEELRQLQFSQTNIYSGIDMPILSDQLKNLETKFAPAVIDAEQKMTAMGYKKTDKGWLMTDDKKLKLTVASVKDAQYQPVAEYVADKLRNFGIETELKLVDLANNSLAGFQEIFTGKSYDILVYEINLGSDPDVYGYWHSSQTGASGLNFSNYSNKTVDDLLSTARLRSDLSLRQAKYDRFLQQWLNDIPAVGLLRSNLYYYSLPGVNTFDTTVKINQPSDRYYGVLGWSGGLQAVYKTP